MNFLFENFSHSGLIHIEQDGYVDCGYNMEALIIPVQGFTYSCCTICFNTLTQKATRKLEPLRMSDSRITCPFCHTKEATSNSGLNPYEATWECDHCGLTWIEALAPNEYYDLRSYGYRVVKKALGWVAIGILPKHEIRGAWGNPNDAWKQCERDHYYKLTHPRNEWI